MIKNWISGEYIKFAIKSFLYERKILESMITQSRPKAKATGKRYHPFRDKRLFEKGNEPTLTKVGAKKVVSIRTSGGNSKLRLLRQEYANVFDRKTKKYAKSKIKTVVENPANRHYVRRNIMTQGTVIDTDLGKAIITNRPGQEGVINAVLV